MVHLTNGIDTGGFSKRWPKIFPNVLDGIDTKPIDVVVFHQSFNPADVCADDPRVFGIDVWQRKLVVAQPTLFDIRLVVVVSD